MPISMHSSTIKSSSVPVQYEWFEGEKAQVVISSQLKLHFHENVNISFLRFPYITFRQKFDIAASTNRAVLNLIIFATCNCSSIANC